jgi:para-nitrobenzyl esterase
MFRLDRGPRLFSLLGFGPTHGVDVIMLFGQLDRIERMLGAARSDAAIASNLRSDLIAFARSGEPDQGWLPYDTTNRATQVYTTERTMINDPEKDRRLSWEGFVGYV